MKRVTNSDDTDNGDGVMKLMKRVTNSDDVDNGDDVDDDDVDEEGNDE
jgi:hypothetical protein